MVCDKKCGRRWFGYVKGKADFCRGHKRDDMVLVYCLCTTEGCMTRASFGAGKKKTHCGAHATVDMRRVNSLPSCAEPTCKKAPTHSVPGQAASHCKDHATQGMTKRYTSRDCQADGCEKEASFGSPGEGGKFCASHKTTGMVPTKGLRCEVCETRASFGRAGQRASRCKDHKLDGMVNVNYATCTAAGCSRGRSHGLEGGEPTFCSIHAGAGMLNLREKLCSAEGCSVAPVFGYPGEERTRCKKHKVEGMVNVKKKTCASDGCSLAANFAFPGRVGTWCATHKTEGMKNVTSKKCDHEGCAHQAAYGLPGTTPTRCGMHMQSGFVNMCLNPCASCGLKYQMPKNSLCPYCEPESKLRSETREAVVAEFVDGTFPNAPYRRNQRLPGRFCVDDHHRPDFLFDMGTHLVVLEVDQNQHKSYAEECELVRMHAIVETSGMPVRFIRYNPDGFKMEGRQMEVAREERHVVLERELKRAFEDTDESNRMSVKNLFYDTRDGNAYVQDVSEEVGTTIDNMITCGVITLARA
jgi:hypothetical protein